MGMLDEVKSGGISGILGLDQINGGGNPVWEFWQLKPCCPDFVGALTCLAAWLLCGPCSAAKLYSQSMGQTWHCVPGCLCVVCCPVIPAVATRYGLRKGPGNIVGDVVCCLVCGPCAACQTLRWATVSQWMPWYEIPPAITLIAPQIKLIK